MLIEEVDPAEAARQAAAVGESAIGDAMGGVALCVPCRMSWRMGAHLGCVVQEFVGALDHHR